LFIYGDKVKILSPGGFVAGFNKEDFGKVSIRRNELIADISRFDITGIINY
jgi:predicted HTH transcriptional regulator